MLRAFNAFQLVALFSGLPFLISWIGTDPFPYSVAAFWASIVVYVVAFIALVVAVTEFFDKNR